MQIAGTTVLLMSLTLSAGSLWAQGTAGAAATMSSAGVSTQSDKPHSSTDSSSSHRRSSVSTFAAAVRSNKRTSAPLIAPSGPPADEVNRKKFEENAGKYAGKILLRSAPTGASIFLNHLLVGNAPLLLFLAPGRYDVEMRGLRQESGHRSLMVTPNKTQTIVIDMSERYPPSVSLHW